MFIHFYVIYKAYDEYKKDLPPQSEYGDRKVIK